MGKKHTHPTKPTKRSVLVDLGEPTEIIGVGYDQHGRISAISPDGKPIPAKKIVLERFFETGKPKKPSKVLNRVIIDGEYSHDHIEKHLLKYERIIFVDTNYKEIDGKILAVSAVVTASPPYVGNNGRITMDLRHEICFEFRETQMHPEHIGWLYAIKGLQLESLRNKENSVALVGDHDLGDLEKINNREKLIAGVMYLPKEFQLLYACADRGQDYFMNKAMGLCDWAANRMMSVIEGHKDYSSGLQHAPLGYPFKYFRIWRPSNLQQHEDIDKTKQSVNFHIVDPSRR